jgi:hypothetical protein
MDLIGPDAAVDVLPVFNQKEQSMMNKTLLVSTLFASLALSSGAAWSAASVGQPAPAFSATDTSGKAV